MLKLKDTIYTIHLPKLPNEALLFTLISIMTLLNATILTLNILNMKLHGLKSKTKKVRI